MSRKQAAEDEAEETPEGSRTAGACVLIVLTAAVLAVAYAVSPEAGILATVGSATAVIWRAVRSVPRAANPAPPGGPEGATDEKPQFSIVEDREGHCTVQWTEGA